LLVACSLFFFLILNTTYSGISRGTDNKDPASCWVLA
jgi:hypothetical protein